MAQTGKLEEAAIMLQEALRLRPDFTPARDNLERVQRTLMSNRGGERAPG
jgi:hypothetical protein